MDLINLLAVLIIIGLIFGIAVWVVDQIPYPFFAPFIWAVKAVIGLVCIAFLIQLLGYGNPHWPTLRSR